MRDVLLVLQLTIAALLFSSCQTSHGGIPEFPSERSVSLNVSAVDADNERSGRLIEGTGPIEVAARLGHSFGEQDSHNKSDILKAELDFGDGSGWQDCTADYKTKWYLEPYVPDMVPLAWMTHHTYTEPGEYQIMGRLTFWDGEAMTTEPAEAYPVTVLPLEPTP